MYRKISQICFLLLYCEIFWLTEVCKFNVVESVTFFLLWLVGFVSYLRNQLLLLSRFSGMHTMCMLVA